MNINWDAVIDELSKPDGWCKGRYGAYSADIGAVCLYGAAMRLGINTTEFARQLTPVVVEQFPERINGELAHPIPNFNDHPSTTLDDVVLCCEKARGSTWA